MPVDHFCRTCDLQDFLQNQVPSTSAFNKRLFNGNKKLQRANDPFICDFCFRRFPISKLQFADKDNVIRRHCAFLGFQVIDHRILHVT